MKINHHPTPRQLRQFGGLMGVFAVVLGVILWRRGEVGWSFGAAGGGACAAAVGWFFPMHLRAIFILLCYATYPVGFAVGVFSLALAYYGVLTPIALIRRGLGARRGFRGFCALPSGDADATFAEGGATARETRPFVALETSSASDAAHAQGTSYWRRRSTPPDAPRYFQQF